MKNTLCWRNKFFVFGMIVLSVLFIIGCADSGDDSNPFANTGYTPGNPNAKIATASTIAWGANNPTVIITGTDFKPDIAAADLKADAGTTGLTLDSVTYDSATQITVIFTGVAAYGKIKIKARGSAFQGKFDDSNTLTITVPPHIATVSQIKKGDTDPTVIITTVGSSTFKNNIAVADLTIDVGSTGLTLGTVTYVSAAQITIAFTGTAAYGAVTIQANASAFNENVVLASNTLTITSYLKDLIVFGSEGGWTLASLTSIMESAGLTVETSFGVPDLSSGEYGQVWDTRYNTALTAGDITSYTAYLAGGGTLVLIGEHSGFPARNNSIVNFISSLGGGSIGPISVDSYDIQSVQPPFNSPQSVSTVNYSSVVAGGTANTGTGAFITQDTSNIGSALYFARGTLSNAVAGRLMVVFDIDHLNLTTGDFGALNYNMVVLP